MQRKIKVPKSSLGQVVFVLPFFRHGGFLDFLSQRKPVTHTQLPSPPPALPFNTHTEPDGDNSGVFIDVMTTLDHSLSSVRQCILSFLCQLKQICKNFCGEHTVHAGSVKEFDFELKNF
jgi:hypothetical protein